jgi:ABC-type molybdate transport system permease subunit
VKFIYSNTGVLIGMVQILLPFMILPLLNAMRRMDMTLIRAAILGATRCVFHVYLLPRCRGSRRGCFWSLSVRSVLRHSAVLGARINDDRR